MKISDSIGILVVVIVLLLAFSVPAMAQDVVIEQVGYSNDALVTPKLWIVIGNVARGETDSIRFGGLDGMLWSQGPDGWILSNHRSAVMALQEVGDQRATMRGVFGVGTPPILAGIDHALVAKVKAIAVYDAGGTRVEFVAGTSAIDAGIVAVAIFENLEFAASGPQF